MNSPKQIRIIQPDAPIVKNGQTLPPTAILRPTPPVAPVTPTAGPAR